MLRLGAASAALKGKGLCQIRHFDRLHLSVGKVFHKKMEQFDRNRQKRAAAKKTPAAQEKKRIQRGQAFANHSQALSTPEASQYRKEGFYDHAYARPQ